MGIIRALTVEERATTRDMQVAAQAARIKMHEYKQNVEAEFRKLEQDAIAKEQAVSMYLTQVAGKAGINIATHAFDFDQMGFGLREDVLGPVGPTAPSAVEF